MVRKWVIITYDIPDDYIRTRVANKLKDYGLDRLQKSVFKGKLTRNEAEEVREILLRVVGDKEADIRIFFICRKCWDQQIVVKRMYIDEEEAIV
mgnify:FL=1